LIGGDLATSTRTDRFRGDVLLSYQPSPGTLLFAGYGSGFSGDLPVNDGNQTRRELLLQRTNDIVFVKLSYLWRVQ
jgi:outer membrane receptor protein involved in Fe transport